MEIEFPGTGAVDDFGLPAAQRRQLPLVRDELVVEVFGVAAHGDGENGALLVHRQHSGVRGALRPAKVIIRQPVCTGKAQKEVGEKLLRRGFCQRRAALRRGIGVCDVQLGLRVPVGALHGGDPRVQRIMQLRRSLFRHQQDTFRGGRCCML